jgi:hypothetical protein
MMNDTDEKKENAKDGAHSDNMREKSITSQKFGCPETIWRKAFGIFRMAFATRREAFGIFNALLAYRCVDERYQFDARRQPPIIVTAMHRLGAIIYRFAL